MLVLECGLDGQFVGYAVIVDEKRIRGVVSGSDEAWYGVWKRPGSAVLVRGDETARADPEATQLALGDVDSILNYAIHDMFVAPALASVTHRQRTQVDDLEFRVVNLPSVSGLTEHVSIALETIEGGPVADLGSHWTPDGIARVAPDEHPESYSVHVEWGPRANALAILNGPAHVTLSDALEWARDWAAKAYVRHVDRQPEQFDLTRPSSGAPTPGGRRPYNVVAEHQTNSPMDGNQDES